MTYSDFEAGLSQGALDERERLRQIALQYIDRRTNRGRVMNYNRELLRRMFGRDWEKE